MKQIYVLVIAVIIGGCSTINGGGPTPTPQSSLAGTSWHLVSYIQNGFPKTIDTSAGPEIRFGFRLQFSDSARFTGRAQCNDFHGYYRTNLNTLSLDSIFSTAVYCEPGATIEDALGTVKTFENTGTSLSLYCSPQTWMKTYITLLVYEKD